MEDVGKVRKEKRGLKSKIKNKEYVVNREQTKFFVDMGNNKNMLESVYNLLAKTNKKEFGREIIFKDLALFGLSKISDKDIEKIKEESLSEMEKVNLSCIEHNKKTGQELSLGEFLVKKLNIN